MAIYTEYGRYLKAKKFKDSVEATNSGMYMLLGLGDPRWDYDANHTMPIAPYNTSVVENPGQFSDSRVSLKFLQNTSATATTIGLSNGRITDNTYIGKCKDIVPPFPGTWSDTVGSMSLFNDIDSNNFADHYITKTSSSYCIDGGATVTLPPNSTDNIIKRQYFAEMYLRGQRPEIKNPVGLLGAVKCTVSYVVDIGSSGSAYKGHEDQFWYGDRFWQIVTVNEHDVESNTDLLNNRKIQYPHHLLFTAIINPRDLCDVLEIDQCIAPMQVALYMKTDTTKLSMPHYRVGEYIFNFGQYSVTDINGLSEGDRGKMLNFTLPCTVGGNKYPDPQFEFVLNDYIKGSPRQQHMVDRIGYIIGF